MEIKFERLTTENYHLTRDFRVNPSSCKDPGYFSWYLQFAALPDWQKGLSTTHMMVQRGDGEDKILGYISLRASSYIKNTGDALLGEPAIEVFELAVADGMERCGIGSALIRLAIGIAMLTRESNMGIRYLLVCATKDALPFYEKKFHKMSSYGEIPRDQMNQTCIPMIMELPIEQ